MKLFTVSMRYLLLLVLTLPNLGSELSIQSDEVKHDHNSNTITYKGNVKLIVSKDHVLTMYAKSYLSNHGKPIAKGDVKILLNGIVFLETGRAKMSAYEDEVVTVTMDQAVQKLRHAQ